MRFGLTSERLEDAFYNLKPGPNEGTATFVSRVEGVRALRNYPSRALLHSFDKHFSPRFATSVRHIKQTVAVTARRPLNWEDVVALAEEEKNTAKSDPPPASSTPRQAAAPMMSGQASAAREGDGKPPVCSLCVRLGVGGHRHDRSRCFIDPKGSEYKEHIRKRRLQECINQGKEIPKDILDMAPFTPAPARQGAPTSHLCQDTLDYIMLHYDVSDGERQALESLLLEQPPAQTQDHFHLQHLDDGDAARALHASVTPSPTPQSHID